MNLDPAYRARAARRDDLDALTALFDTYQLAEHGELDQNRDEIVADWAAVGFDFDRDTVVVEHGDDQIVAYALVLALDPTVQVFAFAVVHPEHRGRGLGSALLEETERRARARLPSGITAPLRSATPASDAAAAALFEARGYRHVRSFWHMERSLPASELAVREPPDIHLRSASAADEEAMYDLFESAFREHFGFEPHTLEQFLQEIHGLPGYDPGISVLALHRDQLVGASLNSSSSEGIGWVEDLGVLEPFRGRGIGKALLARSFEILADQGLERVRLGVDAENASGATKLYLDAGMGVRRRFDQYESSLTGA